MGVPEKACAAAASLAVASAACAASSITKATSKSFHDILESNYPKGGTEIELIRRNSDCAGALGAACVTQTQSCWLSNSELAIKNAALLPPWLRPQCRLTGRS